MSYWGHFLASYHCFRLDPQYRQLQHGLVTIMEFFCSSPHSCCCLCLYNYTLSSLHHCRFIEDHECSLYAIMAPHSEGMSPSATADLEKSSTDLTRPNHLAWLNSDSRYGGSANPFIGRLGGNQAFVLDPNNAANASTLKLEPDAAPGMTIRQQLDLKGFRSIAIWKAALMEGVGMFQFLLSAKPCEPSTDLFVRCLSYHFHHRMGQYLT